MMDSLLSELTSRLRKTYGERLVSVVLYGSAAAGDRQGKFSDYNILCVLDRIAPRELAQSAETFRWWRENGNPAPLLLTEEEVRTSTDCFAIEFHDIKTSHEILFGKDVVTSLEVDDSFYRAQIEHDLRAKLLRLRQKASGVLADGDLLRRLLADSLSTFCVLFRHALILGGKSPGMKKREIVDQARAVFGIDPVPFEKLLDMREEKLKPRDVDPVALLPGYLDSIGKVIDAVDRMEK